jgi:hypothetical protein
MFRGVHQKNPPLQEKKRERKIQRGGKEERDKGKQYFCSILGLKSFIISQDGKYKGKVGQDL